MKKIIFDLDDTLYHSKELREKREQAILKYLGGKRLRYIELKKIYGTIRSLKRLGVKKEEFYKIINKVPIGLDEDIRLYEILLRLKKHYRLIVLSNSPRNAVIDTLKKLGIIELFEKVYTGDDFNFEKPDPRCFSMVKNGDIAVGNNFEKDLLVPKNKGAFTILIKIQKDKQDNTDYLCDHIIENIYQIEEVLQKIG